jgi:hypothetical protein
MYMNEQCQAVLDLVITVIQCHMPMSLSRPRLLYLILKALGTYALFLRPAHYAPALYCQSCKASQCLLSTDTSSTHGPLTELT